MTELICIDADIAATVRMILVAGLLAAVAWGTVFFLRKAIEDR